jgi:hypothetical protein
MRSEDFKALSLNYKQNQFICALHFKHDDPSISNQVNYFAEHGYLAEGAYLRKKYSTSHILQNLDKGPDSLRIGLTVEIPNDNVQNELFGVGPMQLLNIEVQDLIDKPMGIFWDHDYCVPLIKGNFS